MGNIIHFILQPLVAEENEMLLLWKKKSCHNYLAKSMHSDFDMPLL